MEISHTINHDQIGTMLTWRDRLRHWGYRWGIGRMHAMVTPGLYQVGSPGAQSPVLVSANYRMSVDKLRSVLTGRDAWILVIDTKGINVWCAAGKGTFGTDELAKRVSRHELKTFVNHRRLIVPQLGAPGVAAHLVRKKTGFTVVYGPVRAADLPAFLDAGKATPEMRRVTFRLPERMAVIPMELIPSLFPLLGIAVGISLAAGVRAGMVFLAIGLSTPVMVPIFHDWLPGKWLSIKGMVWAFLALLAAVMLVSLPAMIWAALALSVVSVSAYLALNFTGSTTYTSVNGVKKEMSRMLPVIIGVAGLAVALWIYVGVGRFF